MKKLLFVDRDAAEEVAQKIRQSSEWNNDDVEDLLNLAASEDESFNGALEYARHADFEAWEILINIAAKILDVEIY